MGHQESWRPELLMTAPSEAPPVWFKNIKLNQKHKTINGWALWHVSTYHLLRPDFGFTHWCCPLILDSREKEIIRSHQHVCGCSSNRRDGGEAEKLCWLMRFMQCLCDKGTHTTVITSMASVASITSCCLGKHWSAERSQLAVNPVHPIH